MGRRVLWKSEEERKHCEKECLEKTFPVRENFTELYESRDSVKFDRDRYLDNLDVTISSFQPIEYGAYGNIKYSITFVEKRPLKIYTTKELKIASFTKKTKPRNGPETGASSENYVVKSGDTLWGISQVYYGEGIQWTRIYDANAGTIEATAQQYGKADSDHGHWIYPGTALVIPL